MKQVNSCLLYTSIKFIGDAKKQTPVKVYLKGENLPEATDFKMFGGSDSRVCIGDLDAIKAYMEANKELILSLIHIFHYHLD